MAMTATSTSHAEWLHWRVQTQLASLAQRAGATVAVEPPHGQGKKADLAIEDPALGEALAIEVTRHGFPREVIESDEWFRKVARRVMPCDVPGITVDVSLAAITDDESLDRWLARIRLGTVLRAFDVVVRDLVGNVATIERRTGATPHVVRGIPVDGDEWQRIEVRLASNTTQCDGGRRTWVHVTHDGFLFFGNRWAYLPVEERLRTLVANVRPLLGRSSHVRGLVLTTDLSVPIWPGEDRYGAARRLGIAATGREVFVVPSAGTSAEEVEWWLSLYRDHEVASRREAVAAATADTVHR